MSEYVIGIDIGTGSTKALAVDRHGKTVATSQVHYNTIHPQPGFCEQDPDIVYHAFITCIRKIVETLSLQPKAISLSSAMHSVIPIDKKGNALYPMLIWADNRSAAIATRIHDSAIGELLYEQNGTPLHAMTPLCKMLWLKENASELYSITDKFISIKEYIWFRLFGKYQVDYSIASATGMMDIESCRWSENALSLCEIDSDKLSTIVPPDHAEECLNGEVCKAMGLEAGATFIIGASDGCLANLGSFATQPGVAALTIGTSGAIRVASKTPIQNFAAMTFNYRLDNETFICGGPVNNGGAALKWYINNFLKLPLENEADYLGILKSIAEVPPGAEGLIFLPYLFGDRAPIWNSDSSAMFFGVKSHHTQAHFTRAVIEGITMALYDVAENMMSAGTSIKQIHVSGGFVRSSAWLQILADIFNKKICLLATDDASAMGAAFLALQKNKMITGIGALSPKDTKEILPDQQHRNVYERNFERYRKLYASTKELMTL